MTNKKGMKDATDHSQQPDGRLDSVECWDFFAKIYCISVRERTDRRDEARKQFEKVGLLGRVEFVIVEKASANSEQGIYESHIKCLKKGIRAGADNIMIFEDDVVFERFSVGNLERVIDFLSSHDHWNAILWGCLVSKSKRTPNESVLEIKYRSLSHGYVLNRRFAEIIAKSPWEGISYDAMLRRHKDGFYAVYPAFAFQNSLPSDNYQMLFLDRLRRLCGGLKNIQKMNELYHRNKGLIIAIHLLLLMIAAFLTV
jgi:hypothetical protein